MLCLLNKLHYPEIQQCYYDFSINNVKIQEKVAIVRHDRIDLYIVGFGRSKKLHKVPYNYGMNKYYWVNISFSRRSIIEA